MPKAKKRVTKKAYKAKKGRRYRSHTQTEGTSFIGAGRATVTKPDLPMVPFRNTGLITPPPLMQLPTNWQRMSQMGIQPAQFPNIPMQLVQAEQPSIVQQQAAQVQQAGQAMRQASMIHQAGQDIKAREDAESQKKKTDSVINAMNDIGLNPNIESDVLAYSEQIVANQDLQSMQNLDVPSNIIVPDPVAQHNWSEVYDLAESLKTGLEFDSPVRQSPPDEGKYAESPAPTSNVGKLVYSALKESPIYLSSSSSSAAESKETPAPLGPVVVPIPIPIVSKRSSALAAPSPYWNSAAAKLLRGQSSNYEPNTPTAGDLPALFQTPLTPAPQRVLSPALITPLATTTSKIGQAITSTKSFSPASDQVKEIKEKLSLTPDQKEVFQSVIYNPEVQRLRRLLSAGMQRRNLAYNSMLASKRTQNEENAIARYRMEQGIVNQLQKDYEAATKRQVVATKQRK